MFRSHYIDDKTCKYLIQSDTKPGRFYILPKIHKPVSKLPSYVKDTNDFLHKLSLIRDLPDNTLLVTLDVSSLYTNIPHNDGINACNHFLSTRSDKTIPTNTLCDLIRMILTMNNFTFNNNNYLQIHGTAMGTKMAPSFANLFLGYFEANALNKAPFTPHSWLRYIDDIFMVWTEEQIFSSRDAIRKAKEAYLITRANTLEPNGLNKRDETY
ncbi:hypothetical protein QZH41_002878 [Actinostola sp. cb2023]|nr:hypothetical protein QZH41_002878 [Actinostola sp. cb2023]